jgi:thiosulfate reductase cytochrome b subunit
MKRTCLHPLPLRIWHWVNALTVILLLVTGLQFRIQGVAALEPHNSIFSVHKWAGIAMMASWFFWLAYGLASGHLTRHYAIRRRDFEGVSTQMKYYLVSIFRGEQNPFRPSPEEKFNALQKLAYGSVMGVLAPMMVLTGLLFVNAFFIRDQLLSWNAVKVIDALHVTGLYLFALFLVIHVYMATLGPTAFTHIKAMIVGYEEEPDEPGVVDGSLIPEMTEKRK